MRDYYKRPAGILLCAVMSIVCVFGNVSAGTSNNTTLQVTVPDSHTINIEISGKGSLTVERDTYTDNKSIPVARLSDVEYTVTPDIGYELGKLEYDGSDVTSQMSGNTFRAPSLSGDVTVRAVFNKMLTTCTISPEANTNGFYSEDVTITPPQGYSIRLGDNGDWDSSLTITSSTDVEVYLMSPSGNIGEKISLGTINIDKTAPYVSDQAGGITVDNNVWKEFISTITFGLLFGESKTASINAEDPESGIESYNYYISDTALNIDQVKALTTWSEGNSFSITGEDAENKIIYAKITNKAGISLYISSDGMVFDTVAPQISVSDSSDNYSDEPMKVEVIDNSLDSVTLNGKSVDISGKKAEFTVSPSDDDSYEIIAKDKVGNSSKVTFSVHETWLRDGISKTGNYKLKKDKGYKLGNGSWTVDEDGCTYKGNIQFYVPSGKSYSIVKS